MVDISAILLGWLSVFFILTVLSIVFVGDNFWFDISENVMIGAAVGNLIVVSWETLRNTAIYSLFRGQYLYVVPIGLGLLLFSRFSKNYSWLGRYGIAVLVGTGLGITTRALVYSQFILQIIGTFDDLKLGINGYISLVMIICIMGYFLFTFDKPKQILEPMRRIGRVSMMIGFAAGYVSLLMSTYSNVVSNFHTIVDVIRRTFGI
jgi:hypothetical protein